MKKIGVIANCNKPHAGTVLTRIAEMAEGMDLELFGVGDTAQLLPRAVPIQDEAVIPKLDVLMALGGDGTMLRTGRYVKKGHPPVIGVNLGGLGFLTSVTEEHLGDVMRALRKGAFSTSARSLVECKIIRGDKTIEHLCALNDVVIGWGAYARVVTLGVAIDDEEVASYICDGLMVSTPTGSTGHSLSAGGPIIHPSSKVLLIHVLCPHTLSARPLVVPHESRITIDVMDMPDNKQLLFSADGQLQKTLEQGDRVALEKNPHDIQFIHLPGYSYFTLLRQKLHWRGSNV